MQWWDSATLRLSVVTFVAIVNLLVGLAVYLRKPKDLVYQTFGLLAFFYFAWCVTLGLYEFPVIYDSTLWVKWVFVFVCLFSTCTLFFSFVFPKNITPIAHRLAVLWNLTYLGISCYWLFYTDVFIVSTDHPVGQPVGTQMGVMYPVWSLLTWTVLGWAIINFLYKQNKVHAYQRRHLTYLGIAFACWGIVTNVLDVIMPIFWNNTHFFAYSSLSSLFFTGVVALMILRHKFMDVGVNILRTVGSFVFSMIVMTLYIVSLYKIGTIFPSKYLLLSAVFGGFVLIYTARYVMWVTNFVTRWLFYHSLYDVENVAHEIGEICRSQLDLESLTNQLLAKLRVNLMTEGAWIVLDDGDSHRQFGDGILPGLDTCSCNTIRERVGDKQALFYDDIVDGSPLKEVLWALNAAVLVPLRTGDIIHGILLIGHPKSGSGLSSDDRKLAKMIASPISVAVQNSLAYETIVQFNERLRSEVAAATRDLRLANERLEELSDAKDDFINVATHELRNPVVGIRGFAGMLKKGTYGELPEKMVEPVKMIWQCNEMLVELVDDLLKIARSEVKTFQVKKEMINLTDIVDDRVKVVTPMASDKGLTIEYHKMLVPVMAMADGQRVGEVVHNLLSNAVKYSETGAVVVSVDQNQQVATVRVKDQGYGISPDDQEKLFGRFFRAHEGIAHGVPGTGLGLFIVKQYVEKMGGTIGVESELGKGSTFWFTLPKV